MLSEVMKTMNKLHRAKIAEISKSDVIHFFGSDIESIARVFDLLGIEYIMVADLMNVSVKYFTRDEQNRMKFYWGNI